MTPESLALSVFVTTVVTVVTLGGLFLIVWTARCVAVQLGTDAIELYERWQSAKNNLERQTLALEAQSLAFEEKQQKRSVKMQDRTWTAKQLFSEGLSEVEIADALGIKDVRKIKEYLQNGTGAK